LLFVPLKQGADMHLVQTMAYAGDKPWHGLGNKLAPQQPIETWRKQAGMDWQIEESEVRFIAGGSSLGIINAFPEHKVLYRSDTRAPLAVVGRRFNVVQPGEILEFYRNLTACHGFELETAGVLREGRKFWALARTGQSTRLKGRDRVDGYLLLATACDGTLATTAQFTSVRVVCNNTLRVALDNGNGAVKVPHRSQFDPESVKRQLGITVSSWDGFVARMKALADRPVDPDSVDGLLRRVGADLHGVRRQEHRGQRASHRRGAGAVRGRRARSPAGFQSGYGLGIAQQRHRVRGPPPPGAQRRPPA